MTKGKVKWYNSNKGFGFIISESGEDIFFHQSGLYYAYGNIPNNQDVTFEIREGQKGLVAINVRTVE
jgi:CspA family cold shock protein